MAVLTTESCVGGQSPGRLLRRINKLMLARVEARFAGTELGFTAWLALKLLHDGVVGNAGELARDLGMTTGATTRLIDTLEVQGLLERDRNGVDRRVVRMKLTEAGIARQADRVPLMVASWNEILAEFEQDEVTQLIRLLTKLLHVLERHESVRP